jgi:transposase-like protein/IS1 family transposase
MTCHFCFADAKKFGTYGPKKIQRYRCLHCGKTFTQVERMDDMYTSIDDAVRVLSLLSEGVGINAACRLTGMSKETVLKVLVQAGEKAAKIMDARLRGLKIEDVQCDEIWTFVGKKEKKIKSDENREVLGDQYTFVGMDRSTKLVFSHFVGKRNITSTAIFTRDLAERLDIDTDLTISTDSFGAYRAAIRRSFGPEVNYGQVIKIFASHEAGRYAPPVVTGIIKKAISGTPIESKLCTSHVERGNLSMRTFIRRMTRLCVGFSRKLENLRAAVALYFAHYNFCRVHGTLKTTPAIAAGVTDRVWTIEELLRAA